MSVKTEVPLVVHIIYALGTGGLENGLVHVINGTPPQRYRHAIICLTTAEVFANRINQPGVDVYELGMEPGNKLRTYYKLFKLLRRLKPAVVHSRNLAALEAQLITSLIPKIRRIHGEHGRDISDLDGSNWKYRNFRKVMRYLIHHYIAVSADLEDWLEKSIGVSSARLSQIYNGVDIERFTPAQKGVSRRHVLPSNLMLTGEDVVVLGAVGRLAEVKNQVSIIDAALKLIECRPELKQRLRIVIVGEGVMRQLISDTARAGAIESMVWLPGDRNDIPDLLRSFDIFLLPSLGEGISNTLLEAMSTGLPAIASRVGGTPELLTPGQTGELHNSGDIEAMAELFADAVDRRLHWQMMGENSRAFVESRFSWPKTVDKYLAVYDVVLAGR